MKESSQIGFIGLGRMGAPMAGHLMHAGYKLLAYNRNQARRLAWQRRYLSSSNSLSLLHAEIATSLSMLSCCTTVIICVSRNEDLSQIVSSLQGHLKQGSVIIDHSSISARLSRELAGKLELQGISFIDAPLSGGQEGAEKGILSIMAGGDKKAFTKSLPLLRCYAKSINFMGASGSGQLTKMVNQIFITGVLSGLSEGLHFAKKKNLPLDTLVEALSAGAAGSWQLANRGKSMVAEKFDFGFAIDLMVKDLSYALEEAQHDPLIDEKQTLAGLQKTLERYKALQKKGEGNLDVSALIKTY